MILKHPGFFGAPPLLAGLLCFLLPLCASGQTTVAGGDTLRGHVVLGEQGVRGLEVELHRVTPSSSGLIDRAVTDGNGRFEFSLPPVDTTGFTVFFATAEHGSVRYFGPPLHPGDEADAYRVEVFDTTSTPESPVRVARRDLVLLPQQDGSWEVNEIVRLLNPGARTVVSASGMPVLEVEIPSGAAAFEAGDAEATPEQVQRMGERVLLLLPLIPGERELFFRYLLPARPARTELGMRSLPDTMNLFVRQPAPQLSVEGMAPTEMIEVEGERFLQYTRAGGEDGSIHLSWRGAGGPPVSPVTAAVALSVVVLAIGGVAAYRNHSA